MKANPLVCALLVLLAVAFQLPAQQPTTNAAGTNKSSAGDIFDRVAAEQAATNKQRSARKPSEGDEIIMGTTIPRWEDTQPVSQSSTNAPAKNQPIVATNQIRSIIVSAPKTVTITGNDGAVYNIMGIYFTEPDGVTVKNLVKSSTGHGVGRIETTKIPFENLPVKIQQRFNYDPQQAAAYRAKVAEEQRIRYEIAKELYEREMERQRLEALQRIADASEQQVDLQVRTVKAIKEQTYQQQLQSIDQEIQARRIQQKLDDLDWDLRFRNY